MEREYFLGNSGPLVWSNNAQECLWRGTIKTDGAHDKPSRTADQET